jgi:hypothetical protein
LSDYGEESPREEEWFAGSVVKHHRKLSSMINDLIASGMAIERVEEPEELLGVRRKEAVFPQNIHRPSVLVIRSAKGARKGL